MTDTNTPAVPTSESLRQDGQITWAAAHPVQVLLALAVPIVGALTLGGQQLVAWVLENWGGAWAVVVGSAAAGVIGVVARVLGVSTEKKTWTDHLVRRELLDAHAALDPKYSIPEEARATIELLRAEVRQLEKAMLVARGVPDEEEAPRGVGGLEDVEEEGHEAVDPEDGPVSPPPYVG